MPEVFAVPGIAEKVVRFHTANLRQKHEINESTTKRIGLRMEKTLSLRMNVKPHKSRLARCALLTSGMLSGC